MVLILANLLLLFIAFTNTQPFRAGLLRLLVNCGGGSCFNFPRWSFPGGASGNGSSVAPISNRGEFNSAVWMAVFYLGVCIGTRAWEAFLLCDCAQTICNPFGTLGFRLLYLFFRVGTFRVRRGGCAHSHIIIIIITTTTTTITVSIGYYYCFKRAIFAICDAKYYHRDSAWLKEKLRLL